MPGSLVMSALRDRWVSALVTATALTGWLLMAMAVYRDVDLSLYTDLPESLRAVMGVPDDADVASLSYNVLLGFAAPLTIAAIAISIGSSSVAGDERNGNMSLVLASPVSRGQFVAAKGVALGTLVLATSLALLAGAVVTPRLLGVETGGLHLRAITLHVGLISLLYGALALAVGSWSGRRGFASAAAVTTMLLSYVTAGLLPLFDGASGFARLSPWYYFDGGDPLHRGVQWGHAAAVTTAVLVLWALAAVGLQRRDLGGGSGDSGTLVSRLRASPRIAKFDMLLGGRIRVSHLWVKTLSEHQAGIAVTAVVMFSVMGVLMGPMYRAIDHDLAEFSESLPEELLALAGGGDLSTPEGFFELETFSLMAPIAVMIVTIRIGVRALAPRRSDSDLGLLLANPVSRRRVVSAALAAMTGGALVVALATFLGVVVGSQVADLGIGVVNTAAMTLLLMLLGLVFGAVALMIAAVTGRSGVAIGGSATLAGASHLLNSLLPFSDSLGAFARLTPHHYYLSSSALTLGLSWTHALALAAMVTALAAVAYISFDHRDV